MNQNFPPSSVPKEKKAVEPSGELMFTCGVPYAGQGEVLLGHGGGGRLTHQLIEQVFMPAFGARCSTLAMTGQSSRSEAGWLLRPTPT
jgi:hypothetical protein